MSKALGVALAGAFVLGWAAGYVNALWTWGSNMGGYRCEVQL